MKPLHVGLLVVGAALAGGLAVRMSQPPMVAVSTPASSPSLPPPAIVAAPVQTPPPVQMETAAPAPVYTEPAPAAPKRKPFLEAPKPLVVAKVEPARVQPMAIGPATYRETVPPAPAVPTVPQPKPEPAAAPEPKPETEPVAAPPIPAAHATLHQGMPVAVRLNQSLSSEIVAGGDTFQATLEQPLIADGYIIAEKGARVTGRVVNAHKGGRFGGNSEIDLALTTVQTADGQRVNITTEPWVKESEGNLGSALGAIIGMSSGKPLDIPSETVIRFRLATRVSITERPL